MYEAHHSSACLVAEEYKMTQGNSKSLLTSFRARQFLQLERSVYATKKPNVIIEAVSDAMRDYLQHLRSRALPYHHR